MPYDANGRAYDREEVRADASIMRAVGAVVACILLIALVGMALPSCTAGPEPTAQSAVELRLDTGNAALMHRHGMPTKADVMQYHLHGQWGYYSDGMLHAYDALPGSADEWDALYGIDAGNKAFEY